MAFLESKMIVHRDLSARNVLVHDCRNISHLKVTESDDRLIAKVTDFGMSRDVVNNMYYSSSSAAIPVRWSAPEAIKLKYTSASDVWSFGVLCWEVTITFRITSRYLLMEVFLLDGFLIKK